MQVSILSSNAYGVICLKRERRGRLVLQAAEIATIAGNQDAGCTTTDGTNSNAAPFPGETAL